MAKETKENYELFGDNMENFEMREGYFRKNNNKFINFWKMNKPGQLDEFLNNNNVI